MRTQARKASIDDRLLDQFIRDGVFEVLDVIARFLDCKTHRERLRFVFGKAD